MLSFSDCSLGCVNLQMTQSRTQAQNRSCVAWSVTSAFAYLHKPCFCPWKSSCRLSDQKHKTAEWRWVYWTSVQCFFFLHDINHNQNSLLATPLVPMVLWMYDLSLILSGWFEWARSWGMHPWDSSQPSVTAPWVQFTTIQRKSLLS